MYKVVIRTMYKESAETIKAEILNQKHHRFLSGLVIDIEPEIKGDD